MAAKVDPILGVKAFPFSLLSKRFSASTERWRIPTLNLSCTTFCLLNFLISYAIYRSTQIPDELDLSFGILIVLFLGAVGRLWGPGAQISRLPGLRELVPIPPAN